MATGQPTVTYKDIPGFPGYRAGDDGTIISCWERAWPEGITRRLLPGEGAWRMSSKWWISRPKLVREKRKYNIEIAGKNFFVHRLILMTFVGPCPPGMVCCHNNGIGTDNRLCNLRWDTPAANMADRDRHGTTVRGERVKGSKLTPPVVRQIRLDYRAGRFSQRRLATIHRVTQSSIHAIVRGKTWRHITDQPEVGGPEPDSD